MNDAALYWLAQRRRNRGLHGLYAVVVAFVALYAYLFPGLLSITGVSKFAQSWLPLALVSMAQAILMLTGGISLAIGAMVSLGAVIAATTMTGPLGVPGGIAAVGLAGFAIGAFCGVIAIRLRLPAIIVTLAASFIIAGAALLILPRPGGFIPVWFSDLLAGNTPVDHYLRFNYVGMARTVTGALQMGTFEVCRSGLKAWRVVLANSGRTRVERGSTCA